MGGEAETYRVEVGRDHGVNPGHLVGAIANETGLDGQDIGRIQIYDDHSTLELPAGMPPRVFDLLQSTRVLGHPLSLTPHRSDRSERPAPPTAKKKPARTPRPAATVAVAKPARKPKAAATAAPEADAEAGSAAEASGTPSPRPAPKPQKPAKSAVKSKPATSKSPSPPRKKVPFKKSVSKKSSASKPPFKKTSKKKTASKRLAQGKPADGGHSLKPAPFAGGKGKPRRTNKKPRPK